MGNRLGRSSVGFSRKPNSSNVTCMRVQSVGGLSGGGKLEQVSDSGNELEQRRRNMGLKATGEKKKERSQWMRPKQVPRIASDWKATRQRDCIGSDRNGCVFPKRRAAATCLLRNCADHC